MGTNGRKKIFSLFRDVESYEIKGPDGEVEPVLLRALSWDQNQDLINRMEKSRIRFKAQMSENGEREQIEDAALRMSRADLTTAIIVLERPIAEDSADLAPGAETEDKEKPAVSRWETNRRKELDILSVEELREVFTRRQESLFLQAKVVQAFMNDTLCFMILDPETKEPMFSLNTQDENYLGNLMPEIRNQLLECRQKFLDKRGEKAVRKAAESAPFLSSGESPNQPVDTPGATIETPSISQLTP